MGRRRGAWHSGARLWRFGSAAPIRPGRGALPLALPGVFSPRRRGFLSGCGPGFSALGRERWAGPVPGRGRGSGRCPAAPAPPGVFRQEGGCRFGAAVVDRVPAGPRGVWCRPGAIVGREAWPGACPPGLRGRGRCLRTPGMFRPGRRTGSVGGRVSGGRGAIRMWSGPVGGERGRFRRSGGGDRFASRRMRGPVVVRGPGTGPPVSGAGCEGLAAISSSLARAAAGRCAAEGRSLRAGREAGAPDGPVPWCDLSSADASRPRPGRTFRLPA